MSRHIVTKNCSSVIRSFQKCMNFPLNVHNAALLSFIKEKVTYVEDFLKSNKILFSLYLKKYHCEYSISHPVLVPCRCAHAVWQAYSNKPHVDYTNH